MTEDTISVVLNGEARQLAAGTSVERVLQLLDAPTKGVAVACNGSIVPRSSWAETLVAPGDHLEILTVAAGG